MTARQGPCVGRGRYRGATQAGRRRFVIPAGTARPTCVVAMQLQWSAWGGPSDSTVQRLLTRTAHDTACRFLETMSLSVVVLHLQVVVALQQ